MSKKSQVQRLHEALLISPINPLKAWAELGIYRLSARVYDLRELIDVRKRTIEVQNQFGEKCKVAEYYLPVV